MEDLLKVKVIKGSKSEKRDKDTFICKECKSIELHWMKIVNSTIACCLNPKCIKSNTDLKNVRLVTVRDGSGNDFYIPLCQHCAETCSEIEVNRKDLAPKISCPAGGANLYHTWFYDNIKIK